MYKAINDYATDLNNWCEFPSSRGLYLVENELSMLELACMDREQLHLSP